MRRLWIWLTSYWRAASLDRTVRFTQEDLDSRVSSILFRLSERKEECERLAREAAEDERRFREELEGMRAKLRIAEEVTVPALVASSKLLTSRWEAQTSVEVMRLAAASQVTSQE